MLAVNNLRNPDLLFPGQTIIIPVVKTTTPSLTTPFYYTVQPGENLITIARHFELDPGAISFANGLFGDTVVAGQTYLMPAGPHIYIIRRGEHLGTVSVRYGVTIDFLMRANPAITNASQLFEGQRVFIPIIYDAKPKPFTELGPAPTALPTSTATPGPSPTAVPPFSTPRPSFFVAIVQPNESLITYKNRFGVDGSRVVAVNPKLQANPDLIFPGDLILIPVEATFTPSRSTPFFYNVQSGDSVTSIANRFEMTTDTLIVHNPLASFAPGTTILIPAGPHVYIAQPGDTLATVAAKYLVSINFLLTANPGILSPDLLFAGQRVFIPVRINASPVPFN
jgi:LysM repeat protein